MWELAACERVSSSAEDKAQSLVSSGVSTACCETCRKHYLPLVESLLSQHPHDPLPATLVPHILEALCILTAAMKTYGPSGLALSFNGGKDCTVLLELLSYLVPIQSLGLVAHFRAPPVFPSVDSFLLSSQSHYGFTLFECSSRPTRPSSIPPLADCLEQTLSAHPHIAAVILGTRRTDFAGSPRMTPEQVSGCCRAFAPTDTNYGWPACMRVCPLSSWTHSDVWAFLRTTQTPTCSLYAEGFTSLGRADRSFPNQALYNPSTKSYSPAWKLKDDSLERLSRVQTPPPPQS